VFNFLPKDDKFFDELDALSRMLVDAAQQLSAELQVFPELQTQHETIEKLRQEAAKLAQDSLKILDHAFITPLDREDILSLINDLGGVIDEISEVSERLACYPMEKPYDNLANQSRNLLELSIQVQQIMAGLRHKATLSELADGSMKKLQTITEHVREDRKKFLSELFRNNSDPIDLIKKKDLHDLLEKALARLIDVTQILARVLLKNA
jgi:hypothetical protein